MKRVAILLILLVLCTSCKTDKEKYIQECVEIEKSHRFCNYKFAVEIEGKDEALCKQEKYKVNCYKDIAKIKKSEKVCNRLISNQRFECLSEMALYFNDVSYCDEIPVGYNIGSLEYEYAMNFKGDCYIDYAVKIDDLSYCESVDFGDVIFNCYDKFARIKKDSSICENIRTTDTYSKGWCYSNMAQFLDDISLCEKAEKTQPFCYYYFATKLKNIELCSKIDRSSSFRELCFEKVG